MLSDAELDSLNLLLGTRCVIRSLRPTSCSTTSPHPSSPRAAIPRAHLPTNLPVFNSDSPTSNSRVFIQQLEITLQAADYPVRLYPIALASAISGTGLSWAVATLPTLGWTEAKELFLLTLTNPTSLRPHAQDSSLAVCSRRKRSLHLQIISST